MGLESASFISDLNSSNPAATDAKSAGDDHLRLIKSTVKATLPNLTGAVTATHTELNYVAGVTSAIQTQINAKAPTANPTFTGTVTVPTPSVSTAAATKGYVDGLGLSSLDLPAVAVTSTGSSTTNTLELCAATSAIIRTIPAGTSVGDRVGYKDNGQGFATYSLTVTPPSEHQIEDLAIDETLVVTTNYVGFTLRQVSSGLWRVF